MRLIIPATPSTPVVVLPLLVDLAAMSNEHSEVVSELALMPSTTTFSVPSLLSVGPQSAVSPPRRLLDFTAPRFDSGVDRV